MPFSSLSHIFKKLSYGFILFLSNELMTARALTEPVGFVPCSGERLNTNDPMDLGILLFALSKHIPTTDIMDKHTNLFAQCTDEDENPLHLIAQSGTDSDFRTALINAPRVLLNAKNKAGKSVVDTLIDNQDYAKIASLVTHLSPSSAEAYFYTELELAIMENRRAYNLRLQARINLIKLSLLTHAKPKTKAEKKIFKWVTSSITHNPEYELIYLDAQLMLNDYEAFAKRIENVLLTPEEAVSDNHILQTLLRKRLISFKANFNARNQTLAQKLQTLQACDLQHTLSSLLLKEATALDGTESGAQRSLFSDSIAYRSGVPKYRKMLALHTKIETLISDYIITPEKKIHDAVVLLESMQSLESEMPDDIDYTVAKTIALTGKTLAHLALVQPREALETFLDSFALMSKVNPHQADVLTLSLAYRHTAFSTDERLLLIKFFFKQPKTLCPEIDRDTLAAEYARDLLARESEEPLFSVYNRVDENILLHYYTDANTRLEVNRKEYISANEVQDPQGNIIRTCSADTFSQKTGTYENYDWDSLSFDLKIFVPTFLTLASIYHCAVRMPTLNNDTDPVDVVLMKQFIKIYCTKEFADAYQKGMPLEAHHLKEQAVFVGCKNTKMSIRPNREKFAAYVNMKLAQYKSLYQYLGGNIFCELSKDKKYIKTELFKSFLEHIHGHLNREHHANLHAKEDKTNQPTIAQKVDQPSKTIGAGVKQKRQTPVLVKTMPSPSQAVNISPMSATTMQAEKCKVLQDTAMHELTSDLSQQIQWSHTPNFQMSTIESKVEGMQNIPDVKKCLRALDNAFGQFTSYVQAQDNKREAYRTARQRLEAAMQQAEFEPLRKALSDYQTKVEETKNWLKIREHKLNALTTLRSELQLVVKTHREKQAALPQVAAKDNARKREAEQKHLAFMRERTAAKAAKEAEKAAEREAKIRAAFIPPSDAAGAPLLLIENLLNQLSRLAAETQTIANKLPNEIVLQKTTHLSQQFIYLQLFEGLTALARSELSIHLPHPLALATVRDKFAHEFTTLKRNIHWETFAEITTTTFTNFTKHYLYHHGIQPTPGPIQLPDIYKTLFTANTIPDWKVEFGNLQELYRLLCKRLNQDETITLDSPICNAMRMIIVQLDKYIKLHYHDIDAPHGVSMLVAYRNQDAHFMLQHDMARQTLVNLAETIDSLSVKASPHQRYPVVTLFRPSAPSPNPSPLPSIRRPQ